jgi:hypothetical protein
LSLFSPQKSINNAIHYPGKGPSNLPKIYQGIVSQDVIKKTFKKYGHVFGGVSPDIYSGLLLADCSRNLASIDYPFIIPGASIASTAGEGFLKSDREKNKSNREHINRFGNALNWPEYIPDVYTSHTVWALSLYAALDTLKIDKNRKYIYFLYLEMLAKYPEFWREVFECGYKNSDSLLRHLEKLIHGMGSALKYYLPRGLKKTINKKPAAIKILFKNISEVPGHVG